MLVRRALSSSAAVCGALLLFVGMCFVGSGAMGQLNCFGIPAGCIRLTELDDFDIRAAARGRRVPSVGEVIGQHEIRWEPVSCR